MYQNCSQFWFTFRDLLETVAFPFANGAMGSSRVS